MPDNVTPQVVAPAPAGQPAPQAVPDPVQAVLPLEAPATPAVEPAVTAPDTSQEFETLKKRYADSSAEALRLYRENEALKAPKPPLSTLPTYSPDQLETWKEQWLVEAATKPEKAQEAAHQVRLIDAELRKGELTQFAGKQTASTAFEQLKTVAAPILTKFQGEFQPGSPLLQETNVFYTQLLQAGMPEGDMSKAVAALLALGKNGKFEQGVAAKASMEATKGLNQAIKSAAAAGSGAANTNAAPTTDFTKMNPKTPEGRQAFADLRKGLGVGT